MSGPTLVPPGHQAIKVLRRVEGERLVIHTRRPSGDCATLVLLTPVPLHFGSTLQGVVLRGRGSIEGLPAEVSRTLEGFRVRARLPEDEMGIAQVVDAGVLQVREGEGIREAVPPTGHGYVWASTAWVPGETLDKAWPHLDGDARAETLRQIAVNLATLHRYGIFYGDLKPTNVIVGDAGQETVLVDLETMREVPGVDAPVRSLEYTPGYAAPEQVSAYEAYLTSDVWSFGALAASQWLGRPPAEAVRAVTADELPATVRDALPPRWVEVLRACLRPIPQARPRAAAVAAVLKGETAGLEGFADPRSLPAFGSTVVLPSSPPPSDETTRVEDPIPVVPLAPDRAPPQKSAAPELEVADIVPSASGRPPRPARGFRLPILLGAGLVGLLAIVGVRFATPESGETVAVPTTADEDVVVDLREALRRHKTDPDFNGQAEIDRIVDAASAAVLRDPSPEALGLRALAFVWSQRWHFSTADWDASKWARASRETRDASDTVEGLFARAMTMSAACRLMPSTADGAPTRTARCDEAERLFALLDEDGDEGRPAWLAVEIHWAAEVLQMHLTLRAQREGDVLGVAEHTALAHLHCEEAWPLLDQAPVNGDEMNEDCVAISGWARNYAAFFAWSDRLLERRGRTSLVGAYPEVAKIFRGGGLACTYREVDARGLPVGRARTGSWDHFCDVLGLAAIGCADATVPRRLRRRAPDVPWLELRRMLRDAPRRTCLLGTEEEPIRAALR